VITSFLEISTAPPSRRPIVIRTPRTLGGTAVVGLYTNDRNWRSIAKSFMRRYEAGYRTRGEAASTTELQRDDGGGRGAGAKVGVIADVLGALVKGPVVARGSPTVWSTR